MLINATGVVLGLWLMIGGHNLGLQDLFNAGGIIAVGTACTTVIRLVAWEYRESRRQREVDVRYPGWTHALQYKEQGMGLRETLLYALGGGLIVCVGLLLVQVVEWRFVYSIVPLKLETIRQLSALGAWFLQSVFLGLVIAEESFRFSMISAIQVLTERWLGTFGSWVVAVVGSSAIWAVFHWFTWPAEALVIVFSAGLWQGIAFMLFGPLALVTGHWMHNNVASMNWVASWVAGYYWPAWGVIAGISAAGIYLILDEFMRMLGWRPRYWRVRR